MKKIIVLSLLLYSGFTVAVDTKSVWNATSLTPEVMKKIQASQLAYKKCVIKEMQKPDYQKIESRQATGTIIKQCEPVLGKMRAVYIEVKVPNIIADRHLKKMRIQTTRKLLQELMFREASKKAGK
ncbi:MAG: hypothetical protein KAG26_06670 [Methylococcales bacterium]|nr:hypothetical protein [Methylococcales bacterium]